MTDKILRVPLNIPAGERQQEFLDQFNALLRASYTTGSGTAGFDGSGNFRATTSGAFRLGNKEISLTWTMTYMRSGMLDSIEVGPTGDSEQTEEWRKGTSEIITSALAATVAEKKEHFFRRSFLYYIGPALEGEYWLPGFRFAPLLPDDDDPHLLNAERVVVIDMEIDAIDGTHATAIARERALRHAARLGLLADIGLYSIRPELRWVTPKEQQGLGQSGRAFLGCNRQLPTVVEMPAKGVLCKLARFRASLSECYRTAGALLSLPEETRRVLRGLKAVDASVVDAFDRCARLYQVALVCGRDFPSVGFAYRVAAVEAIVKTTGAFKSFSDFVRANVTARDGLDAILEYLYGSVRSAHFHAGEFPSGEFARNAFFDPFLDVGEVVRSRFQLAGYEVIRESLVTWILRQLPFPALSGSVDGGGSDA